MNEEPFNMDEKWRNPDGTLKLGHPTISPGRPKGQSLKEYWRQRFAEMSEEEKLEFTVKVGKDMIWRMAEGNPHQDNNLRTPDGLAIQFASIFNKKDDVNSPRATE